MFWLVAQSFVVLVAYDAILTLAGFKRVHAVIRAARPARRRRPPSVERVCRAVAEACVWYPRRAMCLQRSWVTALLLRRYGVAAHLVIGYRPAPIDSHAWVEVDGQVVNDRPQYQKFYRVLDRL
jgi:hypothetical protein